MGRVFWTFVCGVLALGFPLFSWSVGIDQQKISDTELTASASLGDSAALWISQLNPHPNALAIFDVRAKSPLSPHFSSLLETSLTEKLASVENLKLIRCFECRALTGTVVGDQLVVNRGVPSVEDFKKIAEKLQVEAFLLIEAQRTMTMTSIQLNLISSSGAAIASRSFTTPVLDLDGSSAMIGLSGAVGMVAGGDSSREDFSGAGNLIFLQNIGGDRKGGITLGAFSGNGGATGYAFPTLAWSKTRSFANLPALITFGFGPAGSPKGFGIGGRFSYQALLGFAAFGFEVGGAAAFGNKKNKNAPDAFAGISLGIFLGR